MICFIMWVRLASLRNVKSTYGEVLILLQLRSVRLQLLLNATFP